MRLYQQFATRNEKYIRGDKHVPRKGMLHSTGANNKWLKRYVQPDDGQLGVNLYNNSFNEYRPGGRKVAVHGFIGLLKDGTVATYQTLPWEFEGWHAGGDANDMGYIGIEICEDGLDDSVYFHKVYREAVEVFAYLANMFGWDPYKDIIDHNEGHKLGIASGHVDTSHWFPRFGKSMDTFRADVAAEMSKGDEEDMDINKLTDQEAYELLQKAYRYASTLPEPDWSKQEGHWSKAISTAVTDGSNPERPIKRCEVVAMLGRLDLLPGVEPKEE